MTEPTAPPAASSDVAVKGPDGEIYSVPASQLSQLPENAELATPQELQDSEDRAKYGGAGGVAQAAAAGVARGLTFGLSDQAITAIHPESAETLGKLQRVNPGASIGGEVLGAVAPVILSGGAAAPEEGASLLARGVRAAGALPRGAAALGGAVERGAARLLGEGATTLAGKVAQRAIPSALGAAAEGAAYGIGHEISESAIQDHELTAEKLLAGAGRGAIFGAALGGGLSTAGTLLGEGARALGGAVSKRLEGTSLAEYLDRKSGEFAFRAAGGGKRVAKHAEDFAEGGFPEVGRIWREEAPRLVGRRSFGQLTREELGEAAAAGLKKEGEKLSGVLTDVDTKAAEAGALPKAVDVTGDIDAVIAKLEARAGNGPAIARLRTFKSDVERLTGIVDDVGNLVDDAADKAISFQQLRDFRVDADKLWKGSKSAPDLVGTAKYFGDVRNALEGRLERGIEDVGGKGLRTTYEAAKKKSLAFYLLQDATKNAAAGAGANRFLSLTDNIAGAAGSAVGSILGGPAGTIAGSALGAAANRFVRTRGDFIASDIMSSAAQLAAIQKTAAQVDQRITAGVRNFLDTSKRAESAGAAAANRRRRDEVLAHAHDIVQSAAAPMAVQSRLERAIGPMGSVAPNITTHAATKLAAIYSNLAAEAPKPRGNSLSLTPMYEPLRMSDSEIHDFAKKLEAKEDPLSILDDMGRQQLSHVKVQSMKQDYPRLFEQVRDEVISQTSRQKKPLSWEQKKQLSVLFDAPVDETLTPEFTAAMQATTDSANQQQQPEQNQTPAPQGGGRRPMKLDPSMFETGAQQTEMP